MRKGILTSVRKKLFLRSFVIVSVIACFLSPQVHGGEESTYNFSWLDPDKEVYVLQNRKFRKQGKVFLTLGFGKQVSGAFIDSTQFHGRAGYFFREDWGITLLYSSNSGEENDTAASVRVNGATPFRRIMQNYTAGLLSWAPFYSKLNSFNKIFYYDLIFSLGAATLDLETNRTEVNRAGGGVTAEAESYTAAAADITAKFYISKNWSADLNLTALFYNALNGVAETSSESTEVTTSHWDLTASIGYTF